MPVQHFEVINEEMSNMKISGFVSLVGVHTKVSMNPSRAVTLTSEAPWREGVSISL